MGMRRWAIRAAVVVATTVTALGPYMAAPARTIYVPVTLARSLTLTTLAPKARLQMRPTHVAFSWRGDEGTGVRYRVVHPSGKRSRWQLAPENHDAESGDRHFSGVLWVNRPVAIEYRPVRPPGMTMGAVTVDYLNTSDGPRRAVRVPAVARAAPDIPAIVTRAEWGADESWKSTSGGCKRKFYDVQQLFVHHTAGRNNDPDPYATMRAIYHFHTKRQGWCDIGYNFVISQDGTIFEGRWARNYAPWEIHSGESVKGRAVGGAHAGGFNAGSVGVSLMGNFVNVQAPLAARRSLVGLLAWEADRHGLDPSVRKIYRNPQTGRTRWLPTVAGHRDAGSTACPGGKLYTRLPAIRRNTIARMGEGRTVSSTSLQSSSSTVASGQSVVLSGSLMEPGGAGLGDRPITLYQRVPRRPWTVGGETSTGFDGRFSFTVTVTETLVFRAVFAGDDTTWSSQSPNRRVEVYATPAPTPTATATAPLRS